MIYQYECETCGHREEAVRSVADRKKGPECCGQVMVQKIFDCPLATYRVFEPYKCASTGVVMKSAAQRKAVLKERGLADARDYAAPDFAQMSEDRKKFHEVANTPLPKDLDRAIKREGLDTIL
jgi:putative FmdB family regulatory protein